MSGDKISMFLFSRVSEGQCWTVPGESDAKEHSVSKHHGPADSEKKT